MKERKKEWEARLRAERCFADRAMWPYDDDDNNNIDDDDDVDELDNFQNCFTTITQERVWGREGER